MRKLRKDERICKKCGKVFRVPKNPRNAGVYCSKECYAIVNKRRAKHRVSIGTPATFSLTSSKVRKEIKRIVANQDNFYSFTYNKSKREVISELTVYDESYKKIYIIEEV